MSMSPKTRPGTTLRFGQEERCIVAAEAIEPGEIVWCQDDEEPDRTFTREEILSQPEDQAAALKRYSYMLDDDLYASTLEPGDDVSFYFNHSCEPNCGYDSANRIIALRSVSAGDELCYDYAMTETEASFHRGLACGCGAERCRGVLDFKQWRSPLFVRRYAGLMSEYITNKSRQLTWNDSRIAIQRIDARSMGLFALEPIDVGEVLLVFAGKVVELEQLLLLSPRERALSLQVHGSLWQVPIFKGSVREPGDYINHCCDANGGLQDSTTLVARRAIKEGEEVTMDYATVNSGAIGADFSDNFRCRCGSPACRGLVSSADWERPELVELYWPYFPPFMKELIRSRGLVPKRDHAPQATEQ